MSKERTERRLDAAHQMLTHLATAETSIDTVLEDLGRFLGDVRGLRTSAEVAAPYGHDLYVELAAAMSAAVESRGRLMRAHGVLEEARQDLRLPRMMTAPGSDKPANPRAEITHLALAG